MGANVHLHMHKLPSESSTRPGPEAQEDQKRRDPTFLSLILLWFVSFPFPKTVSLPVPCAAGVPRPQSLIQGRAPPGDIIPGPAKKLREMGK